MIDVLQQIADRIAVGVANARDSLPVILSDPRGHPREAMLLAIIAGLLLIFVITGLMLAVDVTGGWIRARRAGLHVRRRFGFAALPIAFAAIAVASALAAQLPGLAVTSPACGACHSMSAAVDSWKAGSHGSIGCFGCHAAPGALGRLEGAARETARWAGRDEGAAEWLVDSRSCLSCHSDILESVVGGRVRVRHADIVSGGLECVGCHSGVGHVPIVGPTAFVARSAMSTCLLCHDGEIARAECGTCHEGRPSDLATAPSPGTTPIPPKCSSTCHAGAKGQVCIDCHGLVLPHADDFTRDHARLSADDPALCARCHEGAAETIACGCHPDGQTHGSVSAWYAQHGAQASSTGPGGCRCHDNAGFAWCLTCHRSSPW